jgi:hypothetical protein
MAASEDTPSKAGRSRSLRAEQDARRRRRVFFWNVLTGLALVATMVTAALYGLIFANPYAPLNPFPPPTLPAALLLPGSTPTPEGLLPPDTPSPLPSDTPMPSATVSPVPTLTFTPSPTFQLPAITVSPSPTLRATATPGGYAFVPQEGSPDAIPYSIYSDIGCNYMGVGGRVIGLDGSPVTPGVIVRLAGSLEGRRVNLDTLSGTVTEFGESGFGFQLADRPVASRGVLYVQLLDQAYLPMSDQIYFDTYDTCDKNLIFITFRQVR